MVEIYHCAIKVFYMDSPSVAITFDLPPKEMDEIPKYLEPSGTPAGEATDVSGPPNQDRSVTPASWVNTNLTIINGAEDNHLASCASLREV